MISIRTIRADIFVSVAICVDDFGLIHTARGFSASHAKKRLLKKMGG